MSNQQRRLSYEPRIRLSPPGCTATLEIHLTPGVSFLVSSCRSKWYTRTCRWVATKKSGLLGWKATDSTRPFDLEKGEPDVFFET